MKNPYETLGLPRAASQSAIKKKYRSLAKELHPDRHPGDAEAEQRFKELSGAYALLRDAKQRKRFDSGEIDADGNERMRARFHREHAGTPGGGFPGFEFGADGTGGFNFHFEDIISPLFRNRHDSRQPPGRGADRTARIEVGFVEAASGAKKRVQIDGKDLDISIPAGIDSGQTFRLKGKGNPASDGSGSGDLLLKVRVVPHPHFTRQGNNIHLDLPVTLREAVAGARVDVPTIHGKVALTIPPSSNTGTVLRLRGKGIVQKNAQEDGSQFVRLLVTLPEDVDSELTEFVERWSGGKGYDPRSKLRT